MIQMTESSERKVACHPHQARQTWASRDLSELEQLTHGVMGLTDEIGEYQALLYKSIGERLNPINDDLIANQIVTELGDVYYYLLIETSLAGGTLNDLAAILFTEPDQWPQAVTRGLPAFQAHQVMAVHLDMVGCMAFTEIDALSYFALGMGAEAARAMSVVTKARYKPGREIDKPAILTHLAAVYYGLLLSLDMYEVDLENLGDLVFDKLSGGHGWTQGRQE